MRIRTKIAMLFLAAFLGAPFSELAACSISVICPHHGFAAAKTFTVTVRHAGKPLPGVLVEVTPDGDGPDVAGTTEAAGSVVFENLPAGNYHISVSMLGINTTYDCFHVSKWTTGLNAKRAVTYNWGDDAPETREVAGRLTSNRFISNTSGRHPDPSIAGIQLTLIDPLTRMQYETTSNSEGLFRFSDLASGVYVLHSDANDKFRYYAGDLLIRLNPTAARTELVLKLGGGGGDCKNPLELVN